MAKTKISEFSSTPANNTDIDSINIAEGCAPSGINDAIRELMAQLKDFQTGAVGDSFNGPIGTSTAAAGAFTTLSATGAITSTLATGTAPLVIASTTKVANLNVDLLDGADWAAPAALGSTTPAAVSATTLAASSTVTLSGGTANGVAYLNGSKVVTSGSALVFDGTNLGVGTSSPAAKLHVQATQASMNMISTGTGNPYIDFYTSTSSLVGNIYGVNGGGVAIGTNGGTEGMRLTSTGLGIGTTSPNYVATLYKASLPVLQLANSTSGSTSADGLLIYLNGANATISNEEAGALNFQTSGLLRATIDSSGNLGIGTSSPTAFGSGYTTLTISGSSTGIFQSKNTSGDTRLYANTDGDAYLGSWANTSLKIYTNSTVKATLDTAGNLGLGVTPSAWGTYSGVLDLKGNGALAAFNQSINLSANTYYNGTNFIYKATTTAGSYQIAGNVHQWNIAPSGTAGNAITFTQAMTLDASGNLGIGTTSPAYRLDLTSSGDGYGRQWLSTVGYPSSADGSAGFQIRNLGAGVAGVKFSNYANSVEWMRIDSSGNLGLGVTPSAWYSPFKAIDIATAGAVSGSANGAILWANSFINASASERYKTNGFAIKYVAASDIGAHIWQTAPSGTAGNAITFTQAMTLDASGNLSVGTTSSGGKITAAVANNASFQTAASFTNATNADFNIRIQTSVTDIGCSTSTPLTFSTANTERARIDSSGNLLVGTTSNTYGGTGIIQNNAAIISGLATGSGYNNINSAALEGTSGRVIVNHSGTSDGSLYVGFAYNSSGIGSITQSGTTAVLYNTTSDQRLKENIADADSASALIDSLQVRQFDWKADGSHQRYGFVAQELATVYPEAVHQPQDTEQMMAVDYSKLVPLLVKEIQSLKARLDAANL